MPLRRRLQLGLALCCPMLLGLATGCAATRPQSVGRARDALAAGPGGLAELQRLVDAGRYPAAESMAVDFVARPAQATDSSRIADALDLMVEAMVSGGRCWEPRASAAIERSLAIRGREPGPDSLRLAASLFALGRLRAARWDNRGAIAAYQGALRLRARVLGPGHVDVCATLRRIGVERLYLNDLGGADSALTPCAAIAERTLPADHPARIETDLGLAVLAAQQGSRDTTRCSSVVQRTERVYGPWHPLLAERLETYSELLRDRSHFTRAHQTRARAHAIYERALGPRNLRTAKAWNMIGVNYVWMGLSDRALPYFEQSLSTIRDIVGPDHVEMCKPLQDVGYLQCGMNNETEGIALLEQAAEIAARELPEDHWLAALALFHLGVNYAHAGRMDQARPLLERLLEIRTRTRPPGSMEVARAKEYLAQCGGDPKRVRELYEGAGQIYVSSFGTDHWLGGRGLGILSNYRFWDGDTDGALRLRDSSIAVLARTKGPQCVDVAGGCRDLGLMYLACGRYDEAARSFARAAETFDIALGPGSGWSAISLRDLGRALAAAGRPREAFEAASRAEASRRIHLRYNARYMSETDALSLAGSINSRQATGLNTLLDLSAGDLAGDNTTTHRAWDALIRSRAMVLDELGARHRGWATGADPDVEILAARFDSTSRRLSNLEVRGLDPARIEESRVRLARARADRDRAERALAERSGRFRDARAREGLGLDSVAALLPPGASLVAYARYERMERGARLIPRPSYLAFVLEAGRAPAVVALGDARPIDSLVTAWRRQIDWGAVQRYGERAAERRYRRTAERLRRAVWDPVIARLGSPRRVFVVPDGPLGLVNLTALPLGSSAYVLERGASIHYLTTERDLALGTDATPEGRGLLAIGTPAFDASPAPEPADAADHSLVASGYRGPRTECVAFGEVRFTALPASGRELEAVADLWRRGQASVVPRPDPAVADVDVLTGARASETEFRARAPGRRALHLATHGFFVDGQCAEPTPGARGVGGMTPDAVPSPVPAPVPPSARPVLHPLRLSGLALAGANLRSQAAPDHDDGILTADEIAALDLSGTQWAVLSACETGLGEYRSGEGLMGFRRAFLIAGARTTIMSLWRVQDRSTARWMEALYEGRWGRGLDTADAVREASLAELRSRRARGLPTHPSHWAAFIAVGDWR